MAREGEVREQHCGLRAQKRPLPGTRPAPLLEVLPQVGVQRHTMNQIVDAVPGLPTLDGPVPLMVEQLVDVLQLFDALIPVAEQVIDVPKIFIKRIPPRTSVREPQLAEQLVEVPTIVSFSSLQRIMEQTVDIPVPQGGGRHADLQGFLRGQSSTGVEQIVDIPGGGLQGSRPGQGSPASSSFHPPAGLDEDAEEPGEGVFRTFPRLKKVRRLLRTRGRHCSPSRAHPRRLLRWRTPSSGCGSVNAMLARFTSGTDVLTVQSGRLQLVSMSCGTAKGMRREGSGTGTGTRVSPRLSSLLFLLGEEDGQCKRGRGGRTEDSSPGERTLLLWSTTLPWSPSSCARLSQQEEEGGGEEEGGAGEAAGELRMLRQVSSGPPRRDSPPAWAVNKYWAPRPSHWSRSRSWTW